MRQFYNLERNGISVIVDPDSPNWFAGNEKAKRLFDLWHEGFSEAKLIEYYRSIYKADSFKSCLLVKEFLNKLDNGGFLTREAPPAYHGRADELKLEKLKELWLHTNNSCNLACKHCLVNSSPKEDGGQDTATLKKWIEQGINLGVERFYFTGGEPFYRSDIFELIDCVTREFESELIIITNANLLGQEEIRRLQGIEPGRLKLQVSLDGLDKKINDKIRGDGSFEKTLHALQLLADTGIAQTITTVLHPDNIEQIPEFPCFARELGIPAIHLMWPHKKGRFEKTASQWDQKIPVFLKILEETLAVSRRSGVYVDNYESIKWRINGKPGVKFDLASSAWKSLCIYSDGNVYPSAAFANHPPLKAGSVLDQSLEQIWRHSPTLQKIREASLIDIDTISSDPLRFLLGGGDIEHAYFHSSGRGSDHFNGVDPYYPLYRFLAEEAFFEIAELRLSQMAISCSDNDAPLLYHLMGQGAIIPTSQDESAKVVTLHSNCVLGFDVDKPRKTVSSFYGDAAEKPKAELCCPVKLQAEDIGYIPQEVIERFYGCGSPVQSAQLKPGETFLDLGSGAGIDCFIAAKKVGKSGKVFGIDMTDQMLSVANECKTAVAGNLGYSNVEFKKGYLERIPVEPDSIDVITSNCVINLSYDKKGVFAEIFRVLKPYGRFVISDIVAADSVPVSMRLNPILWGECLSGALTEQEFFSYAEDAGFYSLQVLKKEFWREAEGCRFFSVTLRGYKCAQKTTADVNKIKVTYHGPFKAVADDDGNLFFRGVQKEISAAAAAKILQADIKNHFGISEESSSAKDQNSCCGNCCC